MPRHRILRWRHFARLLAVASLVAFPNVSDGVTIRQTAVYPANNHIYHLLQGDTPGTGVAPVAAEAYAVSLGGHLVTLNDFNEDFWVTTTFREFYLYIGLNDTRQEGVFEWYSGEPVDYTFWYPGEPNNSGGIEDWVHIYNFSNGNWQWNDISNTAVIGGFPAYAVMEIAIVPEPPSLVLLAAGAAGSAVLRSKRGKSEQAWEWAGIEIKNNSILHKETCHEQMSAFAFDPIKARYPETCGLCRSGSVIDDNGTLGCYRPHGPRPDRTSARLRSIQLGSERRSARGSSTAIPGG